ncbi:hypothetical protein SLEP1_g34295 [Rubroshorea leprosula]|uniref:Uncharacterized protein n=1 Tax=Rubroshorea leprosula TaxID=152421 RepID=A0AAV5KJD3_9ROSI|nr:hypothetical protein SLEP1_g34295 [Rubroshorea leprosula]
MTPRNGPDFGGTYKDLHSPAVLVGGWFTVIALTLSVYLILQHLRSYTNPAEQKWIVGVLLMVPVYACQSIISLWNARFSLACDILKNFYEAFALYSFGSYLVACLGGERRVEELLENEPRNQVNEPLLEGSDKDQQLKRKSLSNFFLRPWLLGKDLLTIENFGLVQYMILKTLCAFLAFVLELCGAYGDGEFKWYYGLRPIKPLAKFISFKAIVFATWWQGVGIALLCAFGVLPKQEKLQTGLQDFLICIEMAVAAVAHMFVFSGDPFHYTSASEHGKITTETTKAAIKVEEGDEEKPALLEKTETQVEAPGTSITESVQDIVLEGGQHVIEDVKLTINQAIGPVEKGETKIQEKIHHRMDSDKNKKESELEVEQQVASSGDQAELRLDIGA